MYRCKICKKIYAAPVKYCDCGNDDFDVVVSKTQPKAKDKEYTPQEILSWVIFSLCILGAILVWFI